MLLPKHRGANPETGTDFLITWDKNGDCFCWLSKSISTPVSFWKTFLQVFLNHSKAFLWGIAEGSGMSSLEKRRLRGALSPSIAPWKKAVGQGQSLLPHKKQEGKEKWPQVTPGRFRLDIRNNFFTKSVVKHWNRLERSAGPKSWRPVDVALHMV